LAARAIVRAGTGHKYWSTFEANIQTEIERVGKQVYTALYEPPIGDMPIKTLDLPVAGRGYNALPFVFDLVNMANGVRIPDSTRKKEIDDVPADDPDGAETLSFLKNVNRVLERITGTHPGSLGVHPVVYFYTRGGSFQPAAFLATVEFLRVLHSKNRLRAFTNGRANFEAFLLANKQFITQIVHKHGSGARSLGWILNLYLFVLERLLEGKKPDEIVIALKADNDFSFLSHEALPPAKDVGEDVGSGKRLGRKTKSAAFLREAVDGAVKCSICDAMVHRNSMSFDHVERKREGGSAIVSNVGVSHPYCNSTFKN
jgi:hypothetical protein